MQRPSAQIEQTFPATFAPSRRALAVLLPLVAASVALAIYLRYSIIQNTPIGLACEAGEQSLTCTLRLATILLFVNSVFGLTALVAALIQLRRPSTLVFSIGLVAAGFGLVLYNTRLSALGVALLLLSLARVWPWPAKSAAP